MSHAYFALAAAAIITLAANVRGEEPGTKEQPGKYRALVQQLVSPNKAPETHVNMVSEDVKFPEGYDEQAQFRVGKARGELYRNLAEALPSLIAALDDKRYSMTVSPVDGNAYYNFTVGEVCRQIICSHLEIYRDAFVFSKPEYHAFNYPVSKEWFATRTKRSLTELQTEAIDWAIMKAGGGQADAERRESIARLQLRRDEIIKSGKPAKPLLMYPMRTHAR
jgi:hypothetical protein